MQRTEDTFLWKLLDTSLWELFALVGAVAVLFGFGIWLSFRIRSWFRDGEDPRAEDHQMLREIGELRREGDLNDEEYRSIKGRIIERLDDAPQQAEQGE